jgi:hypothetical protein
MIENEEDSYLQDRMTPTIAIAGYTLGAVIIILMFALAAPVYG